MLNKSGPKMLSFFMSALLLMLIAAGCTSAAQPGLTGVTWKWSALEENDPASVMKVPTPEKYALAFSEDGTLGLVLDCNSGSGRYTRSGDTLKIEPGATTLAYCGEESLDMQFINLLGQVGGYEMVDGSLVLHYGDGVGRMVFTP